MGSSIGRQNRTEFFAAGGEMGRRMRDFDWSRTPLGPPTSWPQSLRTAVQVMLGSRCAMWMGWGPELTFFYNDAYRPTLGTKHPWALGKPSRAVWKEIGDDIGPRIDEVLIAGRATTGTTIAWRGGLFERFHRIEGQHGRIHEGIGTGLALVRELARLHGGTVEVTSAPGRGSRFTVSIPAGKPYLPAGGIGSARTPQDSEQRLRSIFAEANVGIAQTDLSGRYVLVNRKYRKIVGRSMQELLGMRLIELTYPEDVSRFNELLDRMFEIGRPFTIELRKVRPDGSITWVSNSVSLLESPEGRPQYVVLIVQDINDRRLAEDNLRRLNETLERRVAGEIQERLQAEEAFRQAQKMEIIGRITGGVAHDFNNLLQVIMGNLDALRRLVTRADFPAGAELIRFADAAARGGQRAATLTQRLLAFARKQPLKPETLDMNRLAGGMSELLRTTVGDNIEIEMSWRRTCGGLPPITISSKARF